MTTAITPSDPLLALAAQEINLDNLNSQIDTEELQTARREQQSALEQQIQKLHEAAHDVRVGAWVQGGIAIVGSVADFGSAAVHPLNSEVYTTAMRSSKELEAIGKALSAVAPAAGHLAGDAPQADDTADAKAAEARAADASSRAEEAEHHRERTEQMSDRTLSSLDGIINSEAQGNLALIANV